MPGSHGPPNFNDVRRVLGSTTLWVAAAFLLVVAVLIGMFRFGEVSGEQVGVLLNRLTGDMTVIEDSGTHFYFGPTHDFYALDKTLQTLVMTAEPGTQDRGDNLKVKTVDGSDVYVDLKVQYRIDLTQADVVLRTSGPGDAFKQKWMRDYMRSICRNFLGELTTEDFYDAGKRQQKLDRALRESRQALEDFGIVVDDIVIPSRPTFYKEYAEKIREKKLADQAVLEEQSKAQAAKQRQQTLIVEETNKKNVAVEEFRGKMQQLVVEAEAEADKVRKGALGYYDRVTIGAKAELYRAQKEAEGILARKKAQAEGIAALRRALEGEGGRNMVKLEYAKKLRDVTVTGRPFTVEGRTRRFEHLGPEAVEGAAAARRMPAARGASAGHEAGVASEASDTSAASSQGDTP